MGSYGCIGEQGHGRNEKQLEKKKKWSCLADFFNVCQGEKTQEVGSDGWGGQIGLFYENFGKIRGSWHFCVSTAKKQKAAYCNNPKKHQNQQIQIDSDQAK